MARTADGVLDALTGARRPVAEWAREPLAPGSVLLEAAPGAPPVGEPNSADGVLLQLVLHRCDVRACVNPAHLFLGTPKDNSQDAVKKGRNTKLYGEQNGKAKLTRAAVLAIRRICKRGGVYQKTVAKRFGVSEATVSYVVHGGRWEKLTRGK